MSPSGTTSTSSRGSFPRVSGDEPHTGGQLVTIERFSPRERG